MASGTQSSDQQLLTAYFCDGREEAFAELVERHKSVVWSTALRICSDRDDARDAIQRALIVFARKAGGVDRMSSVGAWLHRAVTLESLAVRRQRLKRRTREKEAMRQYQIESDGEALADAIAAELDQSINALSARDRDVIVMHYLDGLTFRAIAGAMGGTSEAWQKRCARALDKLAGKLRIRGVPVPAVALGAFLTASPAEAGIPATVLAQMTREVLSRVEIPGGAAKGLSFGLTIMKMKTALIACFAGGAVVSAGWEASRPDGPPSGSPAILPAANPRTRPRIAGQDPVRFRLEVVERALREFDRREESDVLEESRLRALMFTVPSRHLEDVLTSLEARANKDRFGEIAAALYARWAELDAGAAWLKAEEAEMFSMEARRGVVLTWLNADPEAALVRLLAEKRPDDVNLLEEFLRGKVQHEPGAAASLVDAITGQWPESDRRLFPQVAREWAHADPLAAGAWVASYWDRSVRNGLLKELAVNVARVQGSVGLALADHIDDAGMRADARLKAIRWWGTITGGYALDAKTAVPGNDLTGGFPADWNSAEIQRFSMATMVNFSEKYGELLLIAQDEAQRQAVHEGVIWGAGFSSPANVSSAVEEVADSYARTATGAGRLRIFIRRWHEREPEAAEAWLVKQPGSVKTQIMRAELSPEEKQ